jgi:hypothetical protein
MWPHISFVAISKRVLLNSRRIHRVPVFILLSSSPTQIYKRVDNLSRTWRIPAHADIDRNVAIHRSGHGIATLTIASG